MKFYALVILPKDTELADPKAIERAAETVMRPFKMWEDDVPASNGHWDAFSCCTKAELKDMAFDHPAYTDGPEAQDLAVLPLESLKPEHVVFALVTPRGQWFSSDAGFFDEDPEWPARALRICQDYPGHHAVLAYCHG